MSHRIASAILFAGIVLSACHPDRTVGPSLGSRSIAGIPALIQQGACGSPSAFPFLAPGTTRPLGSFTTYWDDYNLYGQFQAGEGAGFSRSSLAFLELPDVVFLPTRPDGKVDAEALPLQTRSETPVPVIEQRIPMDGVNDLLQEYGAVPKVVIQGANGIRRQAWAGEAIPWDKDPEARDVPVYMIPLCGPRVTVVMDLNLFDQAGLSGNARFADALLWQKEEPAGKAVYFGRNFGVNGSFTVMFDRGRASPCWSDGSCSDAALAALREAYNSVALVAGVSDIFSSPGTLLSIPPEVGLLFLWLPRQAYTIGEIDAFKAYLAEGGRIVYVADRSEYYGSSGRATLDQFLADMGSGAKSVDGGFDCGGYHDLPLGTLAPHRLTDGVTSVRVRCTGALATDPRDFILFRNAAGTRVTGASVAVTTEPIAAHRSLPR